MIEDMIFIGNKNNPYYMIEFNKNKKKITIYKPDKYSLKMKGFLEKYTLGEIMYEIHYKKYFYIRNDCKKYMNEYLNVSDNVYLLSEIVFQIKDEYLLIKDDVYESKIF